MSDSETRAIMPRTVRESRPLSQDGHCEFISTGPRFAYGRGISEARSMPSPRLAVRRKCCGRVTHSHLTTANALANLSGRGKRHDKIGINLSNGRPKSALAQERPRKGRQCCIGRDTGSFGAAGQSGTKGLRFVHREGAVRAIGQKSKDRKRGQCPEDGPCCVPDGAGNAPSSQSGFSSVKGVLL